MKRIRNGATLIVPLVVLVCACAGFSLWLLATPTNGANTASKQIRDSLLQIPKVGETLRSINETVRYFASRMTIFPGNTEGPRGFGLLPIAVIMLVVLPVIIFVLVGRRR